MSAAKISLDSDFVVSQGSYILQYTLYFHNKTDILLNERFLLSIAMSNERTGAFPDFRFWIFHLFETETGTSFDPICEFLVKVDRRSDPQHFVVKFTEKLGEMY